MPWMDWFKPKQPAHPIVQAVLALRDTVYPWQDGISKTTIKAVTSDPIEDVEGVEPSKYKKVDIAFDGGNSPLLAVFYKTVFECLLQDQSLAFVNMSSANSGRLALNVDAGKVDAFTDKLHQWTGNIAHNPQFSGEFKTGLACAVRHKALQDGGIHSPTVSFGCYIDKQQPHIYVRIKDVELAKAEPFKSIGGEISPYTPGGFTRIKASPCGDVTFKLSERDLNSFYDAFHQACEQYTASTQRHGSRLSHTPPPQGRAPSR